MMEIAIARSKDKAKDLAPIVVVEERFEVLTSNYGLN